MPPLRSKLFAGDALLQSIADAPEETGPRLSSTKNRTAPAVQKVQRALLDWRPDCLPRFGADGTYGSETTAAVKAFQTEQFGIQNPTGSVGPRTTNRLDEMQVARDASTEPQPAGPRVRRDIQSLLDEGPSGRAVIDAYARGVQAMRALDPATGDPTNPRSWRYQAAIHGYPGLEASLTDPNVWGNCRHFSWFFLAWHRLYLYYFERIVQSHIGDPTWSLPYWDYTKGNDDARRLPLPFRSPADEAANPLFTTQRNPRVNDEVNPLPLRATSTDAAPALRLAVFASPPASAGATFGGGIFADVGSPNAGAGGLLEETPHGMVHGGVGGLMGFFDTAALDPIFWLHHCNIDRLWDVWIDLYGPAALPADNVWLDTRFTFFDADGSRQQNLRIRDILVSTALGYRYESTGPPSNFTAIAPSPFRPFADTFAGDAAGLADALQKEVAAMTEPELLGAAPQVDLSKRADVSIRLDEAAATPLLDMAKEGPQRWFLRVENIAGTEPGAVAVDVFVNLPPGADPREHPERRAGVISTFGVVEATASDHGGVGKTSAFDITDMVGALRAAGDFGGLDVTVTLVPTDVAGDPIEGGDVSAGRVSVFAG